MDDPIDLDFTMSEPLDLPMTVTTQLEAPYLFLNDTTTNDINSTGTDANSMMYGEELTQTWNLAFVVFAYVVSTVSAYSAVHLMDHSLWRAEELKKAAIIKYPDVYAAVMLGFGAVWCMHFVGMSAVTLEGVPMCYDWAITVGSLAVVVVLMLGAIKVAGKDVFATPDRERILEEIVGHNYVSKQEANWALTRVTYFSRLHYLAMGSFLAASGAVVMHYTGMLAQKGPFHREWSIPYITISVLMAIAICFVGFWIIFRLRWKIKQMWLRFFSAAVIALAVCTLHFFGMLSVSYYAEPDLADSVCKRTFDQHNATPNSWTDHQMIVVAIGIVIPSLAFYISNIINQELILAYEVTARSNAIVSQLFPAQIRERMVADEKSKLKNFLRNDDDDDGNTDPLGLSDPDGVLRGSKPIADLFNATTIMFADIAGFTAWASEREPSQVFQLLETIYQKFDSICKKTGVFKVETIGDCYVAVAGLPDPREDHAVVMCQVASRCVYHMGLLTKRLEVKLGPDTGDLNIRIGLHSGPVTAGVLRGDRARFQLFGDTMNTASRMESTGLPGKVQISGETATLLREAGKGAWVTPRASEVFVKGKGELQTYWMNATSDSASVTTSEASGSIMSGAFKGLSDNKNERLIEWNVLIMKVMLKQIVARRNAMKGKPDNVNENIVHPKQGETVIDEVCEIIQLPAFDANLCKNEEDPESIVLPPAVTEQLRIYVAGIADMYRHNAFHNFEHASHVTMSVSKLLSRIVARTSDKLVAGKSVKSSLHDHTYGITSDPLTQFTCVLASLIHDVDHEGVPNSTLVDEGHHVAVKYHNKSAAEQNSIDMAWALFMDEKFKDLRSTIYGTDEELKRFRSLLVNSVMATDIMDKDLKSLRNARWTKAFSAQSVASTALSVSSSDGAGQEERQLVTNRKATVVIEHVIQASDVAHTMQHWHVYRRWNERLFTEMYVAFNEGRAERDPADFWFRGELGFFDFYIIPLAKKLKDCGVFGVSSDEYLNYAESNRREWELRGPAIVKEMVLNVRTQLGLNDPSLPRSKSVTSLTGSVCSLKVMEESQQNSLR